LRRNTRQIIAIQVDIERADLRFPLNLFCHTHSDSPRHRHTAPLNTNEHDRAAVVCFQDLAGDPLQRGVHFSGLHQLIIQLQRHDGSRLYARLNQYE